jgi:hypothetical protein
MITIKMMIIKKTIVIRLYDPIEGVTTGVVTTGVVVEAEVPVGVGELLF